ncbi:MAG: hypothetical protein HY303_02350 [Candidatus Wallbacteria bacterium]|nr:hypothetical protein [Candidatus Wallbacteria bacterium]
MTDRIGRGGWAGGLLLVILVIAAFYVGSTRSSVSVHTGVPSSAENAISIEADGWTYGIPLDVAWYGSDGFHESGRPTCLPVEGTTQPITFGAVDVSKDGGSWKAVVWVDCR